MFGGHGAGKPDQESIRRANEERARQEALEKRNEAEGVAPPTTLASKMCIVIAFDIPTVSTEDSYMRSSGILQQVKGVLGKEPNLQIFGAVNETASAIIHVLNEAVEEQEKGSEEESGD